MAYTFRLAEIMSDVGISAGAQDFVGIFYLAFAAGPNLITWRVFATGRSPVLSDGEFTIFP